MSGLAAAVELPLLPEEHAATPARSATSAATADKVLLVRTRSSLSRRLDGGRRSAESGPDRGGRGLPLRSVRVLVRGHRGRMHLRAATRGGRRDVPATLDAGRYHEVLVKMVDVLDHPVLPGAADRE